MARQRKPAIVTEVIKPAPRTTEQRMKAHLTYCLNCQEARYCYRMAEFLSVVCLATTVKSEE